MTLTNIMKKQNPHKCEGFAVVVTETNKPATFYPSTVTLIGPPPNDISLISIVFEPVIV